MSSIRKKLLFILLILFLCFGAEAQSEKFKGYPEKNHNFDLVKGFIAPPKGYGNVPFYWWNGDSLNKERLEEQLDILSSSATDGFAVSYIHTTPKIDTLENKNGYGLYGMTEPGAPKVFSDEWWDIWNWFSGEAGRRGMGVGLDDYTVGWPGNGFYPDELDTMSLFKGYSGELVIETNTLKGGETFVTDATDDLLTVVAWPGKIDLTDSLKNGKIKWTAYGEKDYRVYTITTKPGYVIHPEHGNRLIGTYFNRFESKMDNAGRKGMNYFFQDELAYPISMLTWSDDFRDEFLIRKGYDILPYLPALKEDIGAITPKIRLDYSEVLMDLSEERYYKPIYQWHADRGLIYGCDNLSRGKNPVAYIDYFRAMSWFTAPGNDAPSRGSSFLETKVSSSISHLYKRPRTWLEAFHSMGWGSSGAWLTDQIDHHFIAGGNLVCMHGLYYSTHGGWWEWAPPDFHFRMPYWPHMKKWLEYTERMSYILSQGSHVCDIALIYPTEAMQAYPRTKPDSVFNLALKLSNCGLDFDFVDFRSIRDAKTDGKSLQIANERYKVLIMADMEAIHHSSLTKIVEFYRSGGIVLATGKLPKASSTYGENNPEVEIMIRELFGISFSETSRGIQTEKQINHAGGIGWYLPNAPEKYIPTLIMPDFRPEKGVGKVLHRRIGERDVYMVKDVEKGTECFFRSTGKVELWDANSGTIRNYPVISQDKEGTLLRMYKETSNSYLIVFSPGKPIRDEDATDRPILPQQIDIEGEWDVELIPTLNNKWGDYRFPASDKMIAAEARSFKYAPATHPGLEWTLPNYDDVPWEEEIYGYGPQVVTKAEGTEWMPVSFSWQYGVWDSPGAQGYHGLKGKVDDRFFILDKGRNQRFKTCLYVPRDGSYKIITEGADPDEVIVDNQQVKGNISLKKGWYPVEIGYSQSEEREYRMKTGLFDDPRKRGFVLFYPEDALLPEKPSAYANKVSSRWGDGGQLLFDPYGGAYEQWNFRFQTAPGLEEMTLSLYGDLVNIWIDGKEISKKNIRIIGRGENWNSYRVKLDKKIERTGLVAFSVKSEKGYQGTAVIKEPVKLKTARGKMKSGDWSEEGALHYYSGGINYYKQCALKGVSQTEKIVLDLGEVVATCEVKMNGESVGVLISPPYQLDITEYAQEGKNEIEVLVYSTLSNHYQTIPTPYRGKPLAGLLGPVRINMYPKNTKVNR